MNKEYRQALKKVNDILSQSPENPTAHFFKAQILHEGFGSSGGAEKHLKTALAQSNPGDTIHIWANTFLTELTSQPEE